MNNWWMGDDFTDEDYIPATIKLFGTGMNQGKTVWVSKQGIINKFKGARQRVHTSVGLEGGVGVYVYRDKYANFNVLICRGTPNWTQSTQGVTPEALAEAMFQAAKLGEEFA